MAKGERDLLKTHDRKNLVATRGGLPAAVCKSCDRWFARPPRFTKCYDCMPGARERNSFLAAVEQATGLRPASGSQGARTPEKALSGTTIPDSLFGPAKPQVRRGAKTAPATPFQTSRKLAVIAAMQIDRPGIRKTDLKPEWREFWGDGSVPVPQPPKPFPQALPISEFLAAACPHGTPIANCADSWCANRIADLSIVRRNGGVSSSRYASRPVLRRSAIETAQEPACAT